MGRNKYLLQVEGQEEIQTCLERAERRKYTIEQAIILPLHQNLGQISGLLRA
jgi:hypothetical protein